MVLSIWINIYGKKTGAGMNKPLRIIVDADAIIAQAVPNDIHHQTTAIITKSLTDNNAQVIYPATAITEAITYLQRVLNNPSAAYGTAVVLSNPNIRIAEISQETLKKAMRYFSPKTSKKNTLFDCIVAAIAEENHADAIFSFDKFYKSKGYKLASELITP
jgi:predicted nucleic acid-binding protein